jgi:hypothetical protein
LDVEKCMKPWPSLRHSHATLAETFQLSGYILQTVRFFQSPMRFGRGG